MVDPVADKASPIFAKYRSAVLSAFLHIDDADDAPPLGQPIRKSSWRSIVQIGAREGLEVIAELGLSSRCEFVNAALLDDPDLA